MTAPERVPDRRFPTLLQAALTLAAVVLVFLALDDITTDRHSSFVAERMAIAGCGLWFGWCAYRFVRQGRLAVGALSFGIAIAAAVAQVTIGPGTAPGTLQYLAAVSGLVWFLLVSIGLTITALRPTPRHAARY